MQTDNDKAKKIPSLMTALMMWKGRLGMSYKGYSILYKEWSWMKF